MLESIIASSDLQKTFFIMAVGIAGVFSVLIAFFCLIKILLKLFPNKPNESEK